MKNAVWVLLLFGMLFNLPVLSAEQQSHIVDNQWLLNQDARSDLLIIDARPRKDYLENHIPNAVSLPVGKTFSEGARNDLLAPLNTLKNLFSEAGIDHDRIVTVYDDGEFIDAARLLWSLKALGHRNGYLLDGGYSGWLKNGFVVNSEVVKPTRRDFVPQPDPQAIATRLSTRLAINSPNHIVLDVRKKEEFDGKTSKSSRFGHIPSAINIPWRVAYTEKNGVKKLRAIDELRQLYSSLDKNKRVIAYCNKGKQSALTQFILDELGYTVSAYDGSWFEWGNDPNLPIVGPGSL